MSEQLSARPPRENLVRALPPRELEIRDDGDAGPVMKGYFARFNVWNEIDSIFEGNFMERIAPGAFTKTFKERTPKVLLEHGQDPQLGNKPLGVPEILEAREDGPYYEVPLFAGVPELVISGLRAGSYGASYRFSVLREQFNRDAETSDYNPKGLPERTLQELAVREFGPVTFPADPGASAAVRSMTDEFVLGKYVHDRRLLKALTRMDAEDLSTLAQMMELGTMYIAEQDEPGDEANIPVMEEILSRLADLVPVEVAEVEPANESEDEMASADGRSAPSSGAARRAPRNGTPREETTQTWPTVPQTDWEAGTWIPST